MKKIMFFAAIAVMALTSCTKEVLNPTDQSGAIGFTTYSSRQVNNTKAVMNDDALKGTGFGILASYTGTADYAGTTAPNFMYNEHITYNATSTAWTYSPLKYWPTNTAEKISFFAYAPYVADPTTGAIVLSGNTVTDAYPSITFTQAAELASQIDLVAANTMNRAKGDGSAVPFTFKHLLSRVGFSAKVAYTLTDYQTNDNKTYVFIKSITNTNTPAWYTNGTFTFDGTATVGGWSNPSGLTASSHLSFDGLALIDQSGIVPGYTTHAALLPQNGTDALNLFSADSYLYFVPGAQSGAIDLEVSYDVVTVDPKINGGFTNVPCIATVSIPVPTTALAMGTAYRYTFTVSLDAIEVSVASVEAWGDETDL